MTIPYEMYRITAVDKDGAELGYATYAKIGRTAVALGSADPLVPTNTSLPDLDVEITKLVPGPIQRWRTSGRSILGP